VVITAAGARHLHGNERHGSRGCRGCCLLESVSLCSRISWIFKDFYGFWDWELYKFLNARFQGFDGFCYILMDFGQGFEEFLNAGLDGF
jgi:hypothetical protein